MDEQLRESTRIHIFFHRFCDNREGGGGILLGDSGKKLPHDFPTRRTRDRLDFRDIYFFVTRDREDFLEYGERVAE